MIYWSLYLVVTVASNTDNVRYLSIMSFDSRLSCEEATSFNNEIIVQFNSTEIQLKCIKTDEAVTNELISLKN